MWMDVAEQIFGDISVVKKALHAISTRLRENPPRDRPQGNMGVYPPGGPFLSAGDTFLPPIDPRNLGGPLLGMGPSLSGGGPPFNNIGLPVLSDVGGMNRPPISDEELVFRILCPNEKIGSVIGKGGSIIKNLREETGARIKVADAVPGSEERVIIISANEVIVVFVLVLIKLIVYGVYI
jgi:poly(rC)-binding protein 2/3/4